MSRDWDVVSAPNPPLFTSAHFLPLLALFALRSMLAGTYTAPSFLGVRLWLFALAVVPVLVSGGFVLRWYPPDWLFGRRLQFLVRVLTSWI